MVKVKICGITNIEDALAAIECGADALGFVFAPSPRQMTAAAVKDIVSNLPPSVCKVGVFVNAELEQVRETMTTCNLDVAQLHGDEDPDCCAALFPKVIKVFTAASLPPPEALARYRVAAFMLDLEKNAGARDAERRRLWQLAREVGRNHPVILAGGLTPETVQEAIETARPCAVDVSSGVEARPGKKDREKLRAFIVAAKTAGAPVGADQSVCPRGPGEHIRSPLQRRTNPVGADQTVCPRTGQSHESASVQGQRRSLRLKEYDYSSAGAYFVTICTQDRLPLLDHAEVRSTVRRRWDALPERFPDIRTDQFVIMPNHIHGVVFIGDGGTNERACQNTRQLGGSGAGEHIGSPLQRRTNPVGADHCVCPHNGQPSPNLRTTLGRVVQWFKTVTTDDYAVAVRRNEAARFPGRLWQRNYYDHVIRNETDLNDVRQYIIDNPSRWDEDEDNPQNIAESAGR
jgi:phosphoribosylanthranilate isomerase